MNVKPTVVTLLLALPFVAPVAAAETFSSAGAGMDARLERSLRELSDVRAKITQEKIPLSKEVARLEEQVLRLSREQSELQKVRDSRTIDLSTLEKQVDAMAKQEEFVNARLNEFTRDFEGRLDISELPQFEELTTLAKQADKNANLDALQKRSAQLAVVEAALDRIDGMLGGRSFPGEALSPDGVLTQGTFIAFGPTFFYASDDGRVVGLVENQLNAADPVVVELPEGLSDGIATLASTGAGALPFDATLGKALKKEKARKTVMQYVADGGYVGYVIIGLGLAAILTTLFKAVEISGFRVAPPTVVDHILDELSRGSQAAAAKIAGDVGGVSGDMLATGVEHADEPRGVLEELLFEKILKVRPSLERFLPFLAITAAAAPLLGLLGTVIGMIKTFQLITIFGTGDARSLSSGISEALVTTALGLIIAIPTLILHGGLARWAKSKLGTLEQLSVAFVNGVAAVHAEQGKPEQADG